MPGLAALSRRSGSETTRAKSAPVRARDGLRGRGAKSLDGATRAFFEPRFGADLGQVRVHDDARAAQLARGVNARAFTVGRDIVFGAGEYAPGTAQGRRLIAHELAHTFQQQRHGLRLQRTCLPSSVCSTPSATLENFVVETESDPINVSKASKRETACNKVPASPSCTSDGHASTASALGALLRSDYPARFGFISGIYVDKDMPASYGAYTKPCASFTPRRPGGMCTFVPATLEAEARQYRTGAALVGGRRRELWRTEALGLLTHESEHARFDAAPLRDPSKACKFADHASNLSELAAHLSEMHVYYRAALARPEKNRYADFDKMFDYWVANGSEDIRGIVQSLRCACTCADANALIAKTAESVAKSQGWNTHEAFLIHSKLRDPRWKLQDGVTPLDWPVTPPIINVADLPTVAATRFRL